jgi:hypothetical protein
MANKPPPQALRQAADAMRHALDPVAWSKERLGWIADPWQADLLRSNAPQIAVCCSRQSGKSTATATLAAHTSIFQPGALTLLLSPSQRQASELLTKVRSVLTTPGLGIRFEANAATSLELTNGSRVVSLPSSPDAIRGYSRPQLIVEDEAAFVDDSVHQALRPMMATIRPFLRCGALAKLATVQGDSLRMSEDSAQLPRARASRQWRLVFCS